MTGSLVTITVAALTGESGELVDIEIAAPRGTAVHVVAGHDCLETFTVGAPGMRFENSGSVW